MQGQSGYTRFKHERFGPVLAQSLLISKAQAVAAPAQFIYLKAKTKDDIELGEAK